MKEKDWEIFYVHYRTKKFGTENEYNPEDHVFIVSTQRGRKDAEEACKQYHSGVAIDSVLSKIEESANYNGAVTRAINNSKGKK